MPPWGGLGWQPAPPRLASCAPPSRVAPGCWGGGPGEDVLALGWGRRGLGRGKSQDSPHSARGGHAQSHRAAVPSGKAGRVSVTGQMQLPDVMPSGCVSLSTLYLKHFLK